MALGYDIKIHLLVTSVVAIILAVLAFGEFRKVPHTMYDRGIVIQNYSQSIPCYGLDDCLGQMCKVAETAYARTVCHVIPEAACRASTASTILLYCMMGLVVLFILVQLGVVLVLNIHHTKHALEGYQDYQLLKRIRWLFWIEFLLFGAVASMVLVVMIWWFPPQLNLHPYSILFYSMFLVAWVLSLAVLVVLTMARLREVNRIIGHLTID